MNRRKTQGSDLPHDLWFNITTRLPARSIARFRCVCKLWNSLLNDHKFIEENLNHIISNSHNHQRLLLDTYGSFYSMDLILMIEGNNDKAAAQKIDFLYKCDVYTVVGSIHGLLLISTLNSARERILVLWNPSTGDSSVLPSPSFAPYDSFDTFGFGYDSSGGDYKIVRLAPKYFTRTPHVDMFSLKSNSWKDVKPPDDDYFFRTFEQVFFSRSLGVAVNNGSSSMLYWKAYGQGTNGLSDILQIQPFNIKDERFEGFVPFPHDFRKESGIAELTELGGCLAIFQIGNSTPLNLCEGFIEVWRMKQDELEHNIKKSLWHKLMSIKVEDYFMRDPCFTGPVCLLKNGEVLIVISYYQGRAAEFFTYDRGEKIMKFVKCPCYGTNNISSNCGSRVSYSETLVSPSTISKRDDL
ncbi:hypothetical protein RJ639_000582 [Escallonia herrerae]|uniref:F-box domain-containing protein n=1 Tax=Escallonia herrerae TaxID=1293975 RepID=A0AA88XJU2_9ASTE|nr:hypothetical protein RJ639_000582 [Escallonia herrerae]